MGRCIEGTHRAQATLLPEAIDDYVGEDDPVRVVDAFVDALDLAALAVIESPTRGTWIALGASASLPIIVFGSLYFSVLRKR